MHHPRMKIKSSFSFTLGSAETSLYVSNSQLIQKNEYIYLKINVSLGGFQGQIYLLLQVFLDFLLLHSSPL